MHVRIWKCVRFQWSIIDICICFTILICYNLFKFKDFTLIYGKINLDSISMSSNIEVIRNWKLIERDLLTYGFFIGFSYIFLDNHTIWYICLDNLASSEAFSNSVSACIELVMVGCTHSVSRCVCWCFFHDDITSLYLQQC